MQANMVDYFADDLETFIQSRQNMTLEQKRILIDLLLFVQRQSCMERQLTD